MGCRVLWFVGDLWVVVDLWVVGGVCVVGSIDERSWTFFLITLLLLIFNIFTKTKLMIIHIH